MAEKKSGKRDMMGSRADMISSKFDPVARNQIWQEVLKKERTHAPSTDDEVFQLNPSSCECLIVDTGGLHCSTSLLSMQCQR